MEQLEIDNHVRRINLMSHEEMAVMWREAPAGHPYFDSTLPLYEIFKTRFASFGGMTTKMSKRIGWNHHD